MWCSFPRWVGGWVGWWVVGWVGGWVGWRVGGWREAERIDVLPTLAPSLCPPPSPTTTTVPPRQVPFRLRGEGGVLAFIEHVLETKGHAVVCGAAGAGQVGVSCSVRWVGGCA